jgi:hypothetical protein
MNTQEYLQANLRKIEEQGDIHDLNRVFQNVKIEVNALRTQKDITVAERATLLRHLTAKHLSCKSALKRAA